MSKQITIENYTERSLVVRGDTKEFKEALIELGGKYNAFLNDKNGGKAPGWIFPLTKKPILEELQTKISNGKIVPTVVSSGSSSLPTTKSQKEMTWEMYLSLVSRVERLEAELSQLKQNKGVVEVSHKRENENVSEEEEEEEEVPSRLLTKKK